MTVTDNIQNIDMCLFGLNLTIWKQTKNIFYKKLYTLFFQQNNKLHRFLSVIESQQIVSFRL